MLVYEMGKHRGFLSLNYRSVFSWLLDKSVIPPSARSSCCSLRIYITIQYSGYVGSNVFKWEKELHIDSFFPVDILKFGLFLDKIEYCLHQIFIYLPHLCFDYPSNALKIFYSCWILFILIFFSLNFIFNLSFLNQTIFIKNWSKNLFPILILLSNMSWVQVE